MAGLGTGRLANKLFGSLQKQDLVSGADLTLKKLGIKGKIFCVSMQRNGTSSVGDFLEQYGLKRIGSPISNKKRWPIKWLQGDFESIFNDKDFIDVDILEDDPWWFPEFYKYVFHRFPGSKFILLNRDADAWFKSMVRHSNGFSIGQTELHAKLYRRENEFNWLKENIADFGQNRSQEMVLYDKAQHYKAVYEQYNREVKAFFNAVSPDALFSEQLNDKDLWPKLAKWLKIPSSYSITPAHAHKGKGKFTQEHLLMKRTK